MEPRTVSKTPADNLPPVVPRERWDVSRTFNFSIAILLTLFFCLWNFRSILWKPEERMNLMGNACNKWNIRNPIRKTLVEDAIKEGLTKYFNNEKWSLERGAFEKTEIPGSTENFYLRAFIHSKVQSVALDHGMKISWRTAFEHQETDSGNFSITFKFAPIPLSLPHDKEGEEFPLGAYELKVEGAGHGPDARVSWQVVQIDLDNFRSKTSNKTLVEDDAKEGLTEYIHDDCMRSDRYLRRYRQDHSPQPQDENHNG